MFSHLKHDNKDEQRDKIMREINEAYQTKVRHKVDRVEQRNVLLIGRTRTGKSTIKNILVNPTVVSEDITLASQTKNATFESYMINSNNVVLNIIDTPGLFERGSDETKVRDNQAILKTIEQCIEREITKFHLVGFCASFESGINQEDVKAVRELIDFLGTDVSQNACLIITRCESKNEDQRRKLIDEIETDSHFKPLRGYFKQGIFFSGCLHRDSFNNATTDLYNQFETVASYRDKFIDLLSKEIAPFMVQDTAVNRLRVLVEEQTRLKQQIAELTAKGQRDENLIAQYQNKLEQSPCRIH